MKKNILCVDDEQEIRELITELLETKGYRVVTAADGEDALEKMKHDSFDLFLIDMSMPRMDGMTLLKEIKKVQPLAVVIVLTGFSSIEGAVNAIHAGAYQYLSKPVKARQPGCSTSMPSHNGSSTGIHALSNLILLYFSSPGCALSR